MTIPQEGSSSRNHKYRYDVFISFRGVDTRENFTAFLHRDLKKRFETFYDDEDIDTGVPLKPALIDAIKASRASVIVLSENFANSRWCLEELNLILEQRETSNHKVFPIFYKVNSDDVKNPESSFIGQMKLKMDALTDPEKKSQWAQNMGKWKNRLIEVTGLKFKQKQLKDRQLEPEFIDEVIEEINHQLGVHLRIRKENLIGMEDHEGVPFISSWLKDGSTHTADILTILGMPGIGKTSLALYVYEQHYHLFNRCSFIADINRSCKKDESKGMVRLQKQLYTEISISSLAKVKNVSVCASLIERALKDQKVLIVLDDVDSLDQLNVLLGSHGFHPGSKIIITTNDASLTKQFKLDESSVQPKHTMHLVEGLNETSSMELFREHAFKFNGHQEDKDYESVSKEIVSYCQGHPKALIELGRSVYGKTIRLWEEQIELLSKEMLSTIEAVLLNSFDSLGQNDKKLFKYIASFFVGREREFSETILKACEIMTPSGIKDLTDRFLLRIGPRNELNMHQLFQDIARVVVCKESPDDPCERSLLWCEKSFDVLKRRKEMGKLNGILFDKRILEKKKSGRSIVVETKDLTKMVNLMLLHLNHVELDGSFEHIPQNVRWLCVHGFHSDFIPAGFPPENLVVLDMSCSKIESFDMSYCNMQGPQKKKRRQNKSYSRKQPLLGSLKILNLSFCCKLESVGGFVELPKLERLILAGCRGLKTICDTIDKCDKLERLILAGCRGLKGICETIDKCAELVIIDLSYCSMLKKLPDNLVKLEKLQALSLDGCNLDEVPLDWMDMDLPEITTDDGNAMNSQASSPIVFKSFPISSPSSLIALLPSDNRSQNESFPMEFSSLSMSGKLLLDGREILFLPNCVRTLHRIELLTLEECNLLKTTETLPCTVRNLKISRWDLLKKYVQKEETRNLSPLEIALQIYSSAQSSVEIEGIVKIQPIVDVQEVLHCLGWKNIALLQNQEVETWHDLKRGEKSPVQLFYEFGIFSTFYGEKALPDWTFNQKKTGSSISITVPSSTNNLRGLSFYYAQKGRDADAGVNLLTVIVSNETKNRKWIYKPYVHWVKVKIDALYVTWLSHWMLGKNEMEEGDQVSITLPEEDVSTGVSIKECGVSLVYEDEEQQNNSLGHYKSWNHIIGGDLSAFRLTTGEYLLDNQRFFWWHIDCPIYRSFIENGACYEETGLYYRASKESLTEGSAIDLDDQRPVELGA